MPTRENSTVPGVVRLSLSPRAWAALGAAFTVLVLLLALTTVTLISQRQRTVQLNKQIATLLGQTTLVLRRAGPLLNALPAHSSTVTNGARAATDLVTEARPLVAALQGNDLPQTVGAAGRLLQSIDQPGAVEHTLANLDTLATDANQSGLVPGLMPLLKQVPAASKLISETTSLESSAQSANLVPRAIGGLNDLSDLVHLQTRTLAVQVATLQNGRSTRTLTAQTLTTARQTLAVALEILDIARQTLAHTASIDRKTGPALP